METKGGRRDFLKKSSILSAVAAGSTAVPFRAAYGAAPSELGELTAVAAVSAMRRGDIKSEDYARDLLDRAQSLEKLNAFRRVSVGIQKSPPKRIEFSRARYCTGTVIGWPLSAIKHPSTFAGSVMLAFLM